MQQPIALIRRPVENGNPANYDRLTTNEAAGRMIDRDAFEMIMYSAGYDVSWSGLHGRNDQDSPSVHYEIQPPIKDGEITILADALAVSGLYEARLHSSSHGSVMIEKPIAEPVEHLVEDYVLAIA